MDLQFLSALPSIFNNGRAGNVVDIGDHIEFAQSIDSRCGCKCIEFLCICIRRLPDLPQPIIDHSVADAIDGSADTTATVVAADDDVLDVQNFDRKLQYRQAIEIGLVYYITDIPVHEYFAWFQSRDLICRHPTVRAADPEKLRALLLR